MVALCDRHAKMVRSAGARSLAALRRLFLEVAGRRSLLPRRAAQNRRVFPPRPEGRRLRDGRRAADAVLAAAGRLVKSNVREVDIVGRVGADEIAILLPEQNVNGALVVANRVGRLIGGFPFDVEGQRLQVSATIGIAQLRDGEGASELLRAAEDAWRQTLRRGEQIGCRR